MKRYVVWNSDKTEGFITDDYSDAIATFNGVFESPYSGLGYEFYERYGEDEMHLQVIDCAQSSALQEGKAI